MRRAVLAAGFAVTAAFGGATAALSDAPQDAADANAPALLRLVNGACLPNTEGRLPFASADPALAAAGLTWVRQPPEWLVAVTAIGPGAPSYATAPLPAGRALLTSTPGRLCQITAADTPSGRWTLTRFEALLHDEGGWTLQSRDDGVETSRRRWIRARGPAGPAAALSYVEFLDGGGPERHTRVILVLKSF